MSIHGTLETMSLTDLLQFLAASRKTGKLKFDRDKITKEVFFEKGLIVGSYSNDPKEYLGQVLLHYGKVSEAQLQAAREAQRSSGAKLGEVLVAQGFLSEQDVMDILKIRTLDAIYDLFLWDKGQFEFFDSQSLPKNLIGIEVEPTIVIMEGIYRLDELSRYRTLVPSICYNMHASSFLVYGQLYDLISKGFARVAGELPAGSGPGFPTEAEPSESITDMLWSARRELAENHPEAALSIIHRVLQEEPKNSDAQSLLATAEEKFIKHAYESGLPPHAVPKLLVLLSDLNEQQLGPQEGFVLSRINGEWDIQSILSICPFRDADCLLMIKKLLERGIIGL